MACSNTFGLVTGAFLLGFGLSEIPKGIWRNADWTNRHKVLSHKIAKIALKLDDAHKELSNAIVVSVSEYWHINGSKFYRNSFFLQELVPCVFILDEFNVLENPAFKLHLFNC